MSKLTKVLAECVHELLKDGRPTVAEVAELAEERHGDLIDAEAQKLVHRAIKSEVKKILRELAGDIDVETEQQETLPGLKMPTVIAVRDVNGIYYVRTDMAVWHEIQAGLGERENNIVRAVSKRDEYRHAMDRLRPHMADDPECTVAEALRREAGGLA